MLRVGLLLCLVGVVAPFDDTFITGVSYIQLFAKCIGEENYYPFMLEVGRIKMVCLTKPLGPSPFFDNDTPNSNTRDTTLPIQVVSQDASHMDNSTSWEDQYTPTFNADYLRQSVMTYHAAITNLTCTLQGLNMLDNDLNVKVDEWIKAYKAANRSAALTQGLIGGVIFCNELSTRMPLAPHKSLLSMKILRILAYQECEIKARARSCYKDMLRNSLFLYDTTGLPDDGKTSVEDRLAGTMMGAFSAADFGVI